MKKLLISIIFISTSFLSYAQSKPWEVGVSADLIAYGKYISSVGYSGDFCVSKYFTNEIALSFNYSYGTLFHSNDGDPYAASKIKKASISLFSFNALIHLLKNNDDVYSVYVPLGASLISGNYDVTNNSYSSSGDLSGLTFDLGIGYQYCFESSKIFTELGIAIPPGVTNPNNQFNSSDAPFRTTLKFGVKFPIVYKRKSF